MAGPPANRAGAGTHRLAVLELHGMITCNGLLSSQPQAQAAGRIVARETLKAFRKNVLAKCYGGDVSR